MKTANRLLIGLGVPSVLETGLLLHSTYGTPYIPGSALKGVCAHYSAAVWNVNPAFAAGGAAYKTMFGDTEDQGRLLFEDAWIDPKSLNSSLKPDVMTPHYPSYYSGSGPPTECDDPRPISFLSVVGTFQVTIRCLDSSPDGASWANLGATLCREALSKWGIGGKTRAGYGRMIPV
ncbi:MAG: type III-B CRISPR module RAMP protein Cmr6 [Bryobacterales bacterium]|nr:type III-B CRISPR module RAMP protein Cmr6 [Bryobacterales bacterium]